MLFRSHPNANKEFQLWPYFNYLFFNAVQGAINRPIPTYDDWQYSPVPHLIEQIGLGLIVLICGIGGVLIFKRKQKKGTSARKKYETIEKLEDDLAKQNFEGSMLDFLNQKTSRGEPLSDHEQEIMKGESLENLTIKKIQQESKEDEKKSASKWEEIGFHRQQAGFMQMF